MWVVVSVFHLGVVSSSRKLGAVALTLSSDFPLIRASSPRSETWPRSAVLRGLLGSWPSPSFDRLDLVSA